MGKLTTMRFKTKRRVKNIDQIFEDLSTEKSIHQYRNQPLQEDMPGMGQFYCIECAKYLQNEHALITHRKSKVHKRRLKLIKEGPYTQLEADAAAGNSVEKYLNKNNQNKTVMDSLVKQTINLEKKKDHIKGHKKQDDKDAVITDDQQPQLQPQQLDAPVSMEIEA